MSTTGSDAVFVIGSTGLPNTGSGFAPVIGEVIGGSATIGSITPAVYGMGIKAAGQNGNSVHVNGGYFGAEDESGWSGSVGAANNNFIEGVRAEGLLNTGATLGTAFGAVDVASTKNGVTYLFLIANESEVDNNSGSDAANGFNPSQFSGSYLASNDGANIADAAFIVNPFNPIGYRRGFFVPREAGGAAASLTTSAQFEGQAHSTWGLQLESAIITNAIGIPNNAPIRGANLAGNADYNLLYVGTDNSLHLGNDAGLAGTSVGRGNVLTLPGSGNATLSNGLTVGTFVTLAGAAAVAGASQISLGNAVAAPNTGSCPNAVTGCWVINVAGTARYVPFY
jgi:hypothetical protein